MSFRADRGGQMILLGGLVIVLAFVLFSIESLLVVNVGQETGREAANPLLGDHDSIRTAVASMIPLELADAKGVVRCPTDLEDFGGRVQALLGLIESLESNRGLLLDARFRKASVGTTLDTEVAFFVTDGTSSLFEQTTFHTACT